MEITNKNMVRSWVVIAALVIIMCLGQSGIIAKISDKVVDKLGLDFTVIEGVYDEQGAPELLVFTSSNCGRLCLNVLSELNMRQASYKEIQLNETAAGEKDRALWKRLGEGRLPFTAAGFDRVEGASKIQIAGLLANNYDETYLQPIEQHYFGRHFDANGHPKTVIYGADWCHFCKRLARKLDGLGIEYLMVDVPKSGDEERMRKVMEISSFPTVWVGYQKIPTKRRLASIKRALKKPEPKA